MNASTSAAKASTGKGRPLPGDVGYDYGEALDLAQRRHRIRQGDAPTVRKAMVEAGLISAADADQIARHFADRERSYRWCGDEGWKPADSRDPDQSLLPATYDVASDDKRWFLVRMRSVGGVLESARQFVLRKRMMPYWPRCIRVASRGAGRRKRDVTLTTSAFGSYAMVHMPWDGSQAPLGAITDQEAKNAGVSGFVEFGQGPEQIAASLVEKVISMESAGVYDHTKRKGGKRYAKTEWSPTKGEVARVIDGPFASFNCIIEAFDEIKARVEVWVDIFGRATLCHLELAQIMKL